MSRATLILLSLVAGLLVGIGAAALSPTAAQSALLVTGPLGSAWLAGLQMTVIPLVVALLVTAVADTAVAAGAGRVTARMIGLILALVFVTGTVSALLTPVLLDLFPVPAEAAASLRQALGGAEQVTPPPPLAEFFSTIVPTNVVKAAVDNALLSLIIFTLAFAFAMTRIDPAARGVLVRAFAAIRDTMLVIIDWVLWLAPIGVFALAYGVGARAGVTAFGALVHYILIVSAIGAVIMLLAYPIAWIGGRTSPLRFARALAPAQAVAISTQSSLASLPAMLAGARTLGIAEAKAGVALPLAVAMFRATQPAMNVAIAIYIARWFGYPVAPGALAAAVLTGALVSLGSISLPAQISFFASVAPVCVALGVPIEPLGLLIAVETFPDIFRTLGNVSMDLAATTVVSAHTPEEPAHEVPLARP
ncbi:dicarboxylate/amino acid:cation symporter [Sphingomonas lenta]|uniref:Sodium:dicarboxylate symporter n=1 Tax=Sphingomonas lenta TaxID=1141887 RepID=A0A2A2SEQ2_9SPHN|nr:cation:dicarboxylase symporter family transporter [Sphingomonas lenta]PAX07662.1 sodium:dicarboxylate symporter [Sphingomonas lenta]